MDERSAVSRFLQVASEAHDKADVEQRHAIRALAAQQLPVEENIDALEKIMGWA